jgi:NNP family nitrate/nitrite transporter-like MFS transporter
MPTATWLAVGVFSVGALALGMGNGSVFQLIPLRFRGQIGIATGLVGCAGGIGGFLLPKILGMARSATGGFAWGFLFFAALGLLGVVGLTFVKTRWRATWGAVAGARI